MGHGDAGAAQAHTAAAATEAVGAGLVGFAHLFADHVDFSGGVWSDRAGQSDVARAARRLARTQSTMSDLASQLGTILTTTDKPGVMPVDNDFGDGGTLFAEYWAPALARAREDIATAAAVLRTARNAS